MKCKDFILKDLSNNNIGKYLIQSIKSEIVHEVCFGVVNFEKLKEVNYPEVDKTPFIHENDKVLVYKKYTGDQINIVKVSSLLSGYERNKKNSNDARKYLFFDFNGDYSKINFSVTEVLEYEREFYKALFTNKMKEFIMKHYIEILDVIPLHFDDVADATGSRKNDNSYEFVRLCEDDENDNYYPFYMLIETSGSYKILSLTDIKYHFNNHMIEDKPVTCRDGIVVSGYKRRYLRSNPDRKFYIESSFNDCEQALNMSKKEIVDLIHKQWSEDLSLRIRNRGRITDVQQGELTELNVDDILSSSDSVISRFSIIALDVRTDCYGKEKVVAILNFHYDNLISKECRDKINKAIEKRELYPIFEMRNGKPCIFEFALSQIPVNSIIGESCYMDGTIGTSTN